MNKIAFIGVGVMGKPMVQHLTSDGYDVTIYTRTKSKVQDLIDVNPTCHREHRCYKDNSNKVYK